MTLVSAGKLSCANVLDDDIQKYIHKNVGEPPLYSLICVFVVSFFGTLAKITTEGNLWVAIVLGGKI